MFVICEDMHQYELSSNIYSASFAASEVWSVYLKVGNQMAGSQLTRLQFHSGDLRWCHVSRNQHVLFQSLLAAAQLWLSCKPTLSFTCLCLNYKRHGKPQFMICQTFKLLRNSYTYFVFFQVKLSSNRCIPNLCRLIVKFEVLEYNAIILCTCIGLIRCLRLQSNLFDFDHQHTKNQIDRQFKVLFQQVHHGQSIVSFVLDHHNFTVIVICLSKFNLANLLQCPKQLILLVIKGITCLYLFHCLFILIHFSFWLHCMLIWGFCSSKQLAFLAQSPKAVSQINCSSILEENSLLFFISDFTFLLGFWQDSHMPRSGNCD